MILWLSGGDSREQAVVTGKPQYLGDLHQMHSVGLSFCIC